MSRSFGAALTAGLVCAGCFVSIAEVADRGAGTGGSAGGGGAPNGGGNGGSDTDCGSAAPSTGGGCGQCIDQSGNENCPPKLQACEQNPECQAILDCTDNCSGCGCLENCVGQHPLGSIEVSLLFQCVSYTCAAIFS